MHDDTGALVKGLEFNKCFPNTRPGVEGSKRLDPEGLQKLPKGGLQAYWADCYLRGREVLELGSNMHTACQLFFEEKAAPIIAPPWFWAERSASAGPCANPRLSRKISLG